jgi:hypothetical protein
MASARNVQHRGDNVKSQGQHVHQSLVKTRDLIITEPTDMNECKSRGIDTEFEYET